MKSILTNFLTIDLNLPGAIAFSTQRGCEDASDPYDGLSVCHYVDAPASLVLQSRQLIADYLDIPVANLVIPRQTHSANIAIVDDNSNLNLDDVDGMVTKRHDIALCVNTADCVPVVLCDPHAGVLGIAHSGWRGTVSRIAARTVEQMCNIGALPRNIHAAMGPCICAECFEVGAEVADRFTSEFPFIPNIVSRRYAKPHVDLPEAIRATLIDSGLPTGNIAMPSACSYCNPGIYFSARRLGVRSGRTLTAARLTDRTA